MNYSIFLLLLIGHFLGDFYFQTDKIAKNKNINSSQLIKHCFLYTIAMVLVILPVFSIDLFVWSIAISVVHFGVDLIKSQIKNREKHEVGIYSLDQVIHILVVSGVSLFISQNLNVSYIAFIQSLFELLKVNDLQLLSIILSLLIIIKPSAITVKTVLSKYGSFSKEEKEGVPNTGALIGELERFIILLMLTQGQYAAIGFILTAKSVARYKKIVEEIKFSEYYLLGTFLSTLIVIVTYLVVFSPFFN